MKTGVICFGADKREREVSLQEILLDETVLDGDIYVLEEAVCESGGINSRIAEKKNYELVLRIAEKYRVVCSSSCPGKAYRKLPGTVIDNQEEAIKTDCYLIGRYKSKLLEWGYFDDAVTGVLQEAENIGKYQEIIGFLEKMITSGSDYQFYYEGSQPILIYTGADICYSVLDTFAHKLGEALSRRGQKVIYFNQQDTDFREIAAYRGQVFKAVIGIQTYMFDARMQDGTFAHDAIGGRKYNFLFDHPIWFRNHLNRHMGDLCMLTVDRNYAEFAEEVYDVKARFFPPAGSSIDISGVKKKYGISFLGSYGGGQNECLKELLEKNHREKRILYYFIKYMRQDFSLTPERALEQAMRVCGENTDRETYVTLLEKNRGIIYDMAYGYRKKIIRELLRAGLEIHVFGETWEHCPLRRYPNLILHQEVIGDDSLLVYAQSEISLNFMTWHKDAFTERIANAMLQKSVVVSDRTKYLEENFKDGEDIILFDLQDYRKLPERINALLQQTEKMKEIAENGYRKAKEYHTWDVRAGHLLSMIDEDSGQRYKESDENNR